MKFAHSILAVIAAVVIFTLGCKKNEETEVVEPVQPKIEEFPIEDVFSFAYVAVEMEGSYDKYGKAESTLRLAMQEQGLQPAGPMIAVYYNSPDDVAQDLLKWEVGFPAAVDKEPAPPLVAKMWDYEQVVSTVHKGPYGSAKKVYVKMFTFIDSLADYQPAGPTLERYLDEDPSMLEPDDLQTEIWIPVVEPPPPPEPEPKEVAEDCDDED
jgi:effector-binding domain-containing protein